MRPPPQPVLRVHTRSMLAAAALQCLVTSSFAGGVVYRATVLPVLPLFGSDSTVQVIGLNDAGQVVGTATDLPSGRAQAFVYSNGQMTAVGGALAAGESSAAVAISNPVGPRGNVTIVGNVYSSGNANNSIGFAQGYSGLLGQLGSAQRFGGPGDRVFVTGVNTGGQVVGFAMGADTTRAFSRSADGQLTVLPTPLSRLARATDVNTSGQIAGGYFQNLGGSTRAVVWDGASLRDLGSLGGNEAWATGLNDQGTAVGISLLADGQPLWHAFKYQDGAMLRLAGNLDQGFASGAAAINNNQQTVGWFTGGISHFVEQPFLHSDSGGAVDLTPYIVGLPGGERAAGALAINASGQIIANSTAARGLLLTPEGTLGWAKLRGGRVGDAANWDSGLGFAPSRYFDLVIDGRPAQTVIADASVEAKTVTLGGGQGGTTTLQLTGGAVVNAPGGLQLMGNGVLQGEGWVGGPMVINRGQVRALPGQLLILAGGLDNRGLVTGNGRIEANLLNRGGGAAGVLAGAGQHLTLAGTVHSAADGSHITIQDGGTLAFEGRFVNQGGAFLDINRGTLQVGYGSQRMDNAGQVLVGGGRAEILGDLNNGPRGLIHARDGADLTVWDLLRNDGEVRASQGARIVYNAAVTGNGSFTGLDGMHRFEGGYAPGNSPAVVQMANVQFASQVTMELGGLTAGSQHDHIDFTGSVLFESTSFLRVALIGGFAPQAGNSFVLFSYAQAPVGNFEDFYLPTLNVGLQWDVSHLHTTGVLNVLGAAPVPEPQSWALALLGLVGLAWRLRSVRPA